MGGDALAKVATRSEAGDGLKYSLPEASDASWDRVLGMGCDLTVDLPMPHFTIGDLLKLNLGSIVDARWKVGRDVPLRLNGTQIACVEFEVIGRNLAVRLTELA